MDHTQLSSLDLGIIALYLITMVAVGIYFVRRIKNSGDYYVAGRTLGPLVMMATVCATIIGGMLCGCSRTAAAEFTFFLAIPVMFGWGVLKLIKYILAVGLAMTATEIAVLVVGIVTAFVVSVISIKFLMGYIKKNDFTAFGVYRIIVGIVVLAYFGVKVLL